MTNKEFGRRLLNIEEFFAIVNAKTQMIQGDVLKLQKEMSDVQSDLDDLSDSDGGQVASIEEIDDQIASADFAYTIYHKQTPFDMEDKKYESDAFYAYVPDGSLVIDGEVVDWNKFEEYDPELESIKIPTLVSDDTPQKVYMHIRVEKINGKNDIQGKVDDSEETPPEYNWYPGVRFYNILIGEFDSDSYIRHLVGQIRLDKTYLNTAFEVFGEDGEWKVRYKEGDFTYNKIVPSEVAPSEVNGVICTGENGKDQSIYGVLRLIGYDEYSLEITPSSGGEDSVFVFEIASIVDGEVRQSALGALHIIDEPVPDDLSTEYLKNKDGKYILTESGQKIVQVYGFDTADTDDPGDGETTLSKMITPDEETSTSLVAVACKIDGMDELQWLKLGKLKSEDFTCDCENCSGDGDGDGDGDDSGDDDNTHNGCVIPDKVSIDYIMDGENGEPVTDENNDKTIQIYGFDEADASPGEKLDPDTIAYKIFNQPDYPPDHPNANSRLGWGVTIPCKVEGSNAIQWVKLGLVDDFNQPILDEFSIRRNYQNEITIAGFGDADTSIPEIGSSGTIANALTSSSPSEGIAIPCKVSGQQELQWKNLGLLEGDDCFTGETYEVSNIGAERVEEDGAIVYYIKAFKKKYTYEKGRLKSVEDAPEETEVIDIVVKEREPQP